MQWNPFFFPFFPHSVGAVSVFLAHLRCLCMSEVPKAILIGLLAAFVNIIKTELGLALVFYSVNSPLSVAGGGLLPGEVVFLAIRGQHLGAKG